MMIPVETINSVLVVEDDSGLSSHISSFLDRIGYSVISVATGEQALSTLKKQAFDVAFIDLKLPGMDGLDLLQKIKENDFNVCPVMMSAYFTPANYRRAQALGAYDFIRKPFEPERLLIEIKNITRMLHAERHVEALTSSGKLEEDFSNLVGNSPVMQRLRQEIVTAASHDRTVLILGETGTGKNLVAELIHASSNRKKEPYIELNVATTPVTLMESSLFGHEKGAFTNANERRFGLLEHAGTGTLLIDEIGDIPLDAQVKLLRVLETRIFRRVGGDQYLKFHARIVCATNKPHEELSTARMFRSDLLYRIERTRIDIPPLRNRMEDIPLLVQHFIKKNAPKKNVEVSPEVWDILNSYSYPGNLRELDNIIDNALITMGEGEVLLPGHLHLPGPKEQDPSALPVVNIGSIADLSYPEAKEKVIESFERQYLTLKLDKARGIKKHCADSIQLDVKNLSEKLEKYGITERKPREKNLKDQANV